MQRRVEVGDLLVEGGEALAVFFDHLGRRTRDEVGSRGGMCARNDRRYGATRPRANGLTRNATSLQMSRLSHHAIDARLAAFQT